MQCIARTVVLAIAYFDRVVDIAISGSCYSLATRPLEAQLELRQSQLTKAPPGVALNYKHEKKHTECYTGMLLICRCQQSTCK